MLTNEKIRPALQCQANHSRKILMSSIPHLSIRMELSEHESFGIDSFKGSVRSFRLYLKAQLIFLETGIIVP